MSIFAKNPTFLIFAVILGIRLQNALTISTFFQPDEYFQSLEIAVSQRTGGPGYVTWEWHHGLRSILYPRIFQGVYYLVDLLSNALSLSPATNAELLVVAPKIVGAVTAAVGDVYTGLLARKIWGDEAGGYALLFSTCSAWNWFCSTRTFSNCFETTLTIVGMNYWPWRTFNASKERDSNSPNRDLTLASIFAGLSFTVRPTNGLISWAIGPLILERVPTFSQRARAVLQISFVSVAVLILNALVDYTFYNRFTFPFVEFYRLNVTQSISEFYGVSPWHYYYSQGLPLLLTGYLPLAVFSLYRGFSSPSPAATHLTRLANIVPLAFMITKHKEVRFLYPLLPIFHVLMAGVGLPALPKTWNKKLIIAGMVGLNLPIAYYTGYVHQRGVVDVVNWLRREHYSGATPASIMYQDRTNYIGRRVEFLMPCHSTPFGSYMWDAAMTNSTTQPYELSALFLTCEPPIELPVEDRKNYLDEADQFYAHPTDFLKERFGPPPTLQQKGQDGGTAREKPTVWPEKLITFEATAVLIERYLGIGNEDSGYKECKRFFNSHWHDDDRRKGDVIVWCLR
ncbi:hypothetical protein ABW20_dc0102410 [Dactylellina cionopaga]|nr:hypothetical protein ABW20_dc0102410 [Dactylellina cionopaga]